MRIRSSFSIFSRKEHATCRLFCFPYAGGGASVFHSWHKHLPDFVEVVCAQLPGRETRFDEPAVSDLNIIVSEFTREIKQYMDRPFVIFGHSLGALIGHHLTRSIISNRLPAPACLVVAGRNAPRDDFKYYEKIVHLRDDEFIEALKAYKGLPEEFINNSELLNLFIPIIRSDFKLSETEDRSNIKVHCPIVVYGGTHDRAPKSRLELWHHETTSSCNVHMFPGDHFFIKSRQKEVLQSLSELLCLIRARGDSLSIH